MQRSGSCVSPTARRGPSPGPPRRCTAPLQPQRPTSASTRPGTTPHALAHPSRRLHTANAFAGGSDPAAITADAATTAMTETSITQELAALETRMAAWKEQRLVEIAAEDAGSAASVTAAMEARLQERRAAERTRAQQRLERLLDALDSRLMIDATPAAEAESGEEAAEGSEDAAHAGQASEQERKAATPPPVMLSPLAAALAACELKHLIGRQQLAVEEREARWRLEWQHQFLVSSAQLRTDEAEFRSCIERWEGTWYGHLSLHSGDGQSCGEVGAQA